MSWVVVEDAVRDYGVSKGAVLRLAKSGQLDLDGPFNGGTFQVRREEIEPLLVFVPTKPGGRRQPEAPLRFSEALTTFKLSKRHLYTLIEQYQIQTYKRTGSPFTWVDGQELLHLLAHRQLKPRGAKPGRPNTRLTGTEVAAIRARYRKGGALSQARLGQEYGVTQEAISAVIRGKTWGAKAAKAS